MPISQASNRIKKKGRNSKIGVEALKNKNVFLEGIRIKTNSMPYVIVGGYINNFLFWPIHKDLS